VISRAFFFFASQSLHKLKQKSFSGEVKDKKRTTPRQGGRKAAVEEGQEVRGQEARGQEA
jgi:hypothetical protein